MRFTLIMHHTASGDSAGYVAFDCSGLGFDTGDWTLIGFGGRLRFWLLDGTEGSYEMHRNTFALRQQGKIRAVLSGAPSQYSHIPAYIPTAKESRVSLMSGNGWLHQTFNPAANGEPVHWDMARERKSAEPVDFLTRARAKELENRPDDFLTRAAARAKLDFTIFEER